MKKLLLVGLVPLFVGAVAIAKPSPKLFVCKYVGEPGVDERLQTGQNPISVSQNAIKGYSGVGSYFNDKQGRSLVVAVDTGQAEPSCPIPVNPEEPEEPVKPETPKVKDGSDLVPFEGK